MRTEGILTAAEIKRVLAHLKSKRTKSHRYRLTLFRLAACCGLRRKEISGLRVGDIVLLGERPGIRIRKEITKGQADKRRPRFVPLWWDRGTFEDIADYVLGRGPNELVLGSVSSGTEGKVTHPACLAKRWKSAIRVLGPDRVRQVSIHLGRHTFCSHALLKRSAAEVRDAAGHSNIATLSIYAHVLDRDNVPDLWPLEESHAVRS